MDEEGLNSLEEVGQPLTPSSFAKVIEDLVYEKDINHFAAVLMFCEQNTLDIEDVQSLINRPLKEKLQFDALQEGYVTRTTPSLFG